MKHLLFTLLIATALCTSIALATQQQTAKAGKYTVEMTTQPSPLTIGQAKFLITVKDGDKPVSGAGVSLHADMVAMSMPEVAKATPGALAGQYTATMDLGMGGEWKLIATVKGMADMDMPGDGKATFSLTVLPSPTLPANMPAPSSTPTNLPWVLIIGVLVFIGISVALLIARARSSNAQE